MLKDQEIDDVEISTQFCLVHFWKSGSNRACTSSYASKEIHAMGIRSYDHCP